MSFNISSSKLTGSPQDSGWAQVHEFTPEDKKKKELRGQLFAVVATRKEAAGFDPQPVEVESVIAGRELLTRLHEEYFGNLEASAFNALTSAVDKVIAEFRESWGSVQISAASILGDVVYVAAGGGAQVAIFRDGMLAKILLSKKNEAVSASGHSREDDILVLGTDSFFDTFPNGILRAALESHDTKEAVESLAPATRTKAGRGDLGAVFLRFIKERPPREEVPKEAKMRIRKPIEIRTFSFIQKLIKKAKSTFSGLPERKIYVKEKTDEAEISQNRKLAVSVGIVLLVLLIVSIIFGVKQKREKEKRSHYKDRLATARHELNEAMSLLTLEPSRSRELFSESRNKADQLVSEGVSDPELTLLLESLEENQGKVLGEYTQGGDLFVDLSLLSDGFRGNSLSTSGERVFIIDSDSDKVIEVDFDTKRSEVIAGPREVKGAFDIASYTDRIYLLTTEGIFEVKDERKKVIDETYSNSTLIHAYAANLYVLDRDASTIWRYTAAKDGFGTRGNWLTEGVKADFSGVISWTIDGAIWLLGDTGKVYKYSHGNPQVFNVSGVTPPLTNPRAIYTNEELGFLYVLEPESERVVVLNKSGEYKGQYVSGSIGEAIDIAVSEKEGKIIILTGEKLYSFGIEHLE